MKKLFAAILLSIYISGSLAQHAMKPLTQLINTTDPGWPLVRQWIDSAKNKVEILPCDTAQAREALYKTQVTTRSPMGAIVYKTGGLLIDDGWIRILGSGNKKLNRSLPDWNKGKTFKDIGDVPGFLLVADDAAGGFFAVNGGSLGTDAGKIYYLSPDRLEWEPLDLTYTEFLFFCFNNDLDKFYENLRWTGWRKDVAGLSGDKVFNFLPVLWTKEGKDINKASKKAVPVEEQYELNISFRKQLGLSDSKH